MSTFADIVLRPVKATCDGWDKISVKQSIQFRDKKIFHGIPLIIADMPPPACEVLASTGVMSMPVGDFDAMAKHFRGDQAYHSILAVDDKLDEYFALQDAVVDRTKIKYVRVSLDVIDVFVSLHRKDNIEPPVIFGGPLITYGRGVFAEKQGADALWVGLDTHDWDVINHASGITLDPVNTLLSVTEHSRHTKIVGDLCCATAGEVVKAFVLGADFVVLCKSMGEFSIEEVVGGMQAACAYSGASSMKDLYAHGRWAIPK